MSSKKNSQNLVSFLKNYKLVILLLVVLSLFVNGLGLLLPKINSWAIDSLQTQTYNRDDFFLLFGGLASLILILSLTQNIFSNFVSQKVAFDLRNQVIDKISKQSFAYVNKVSTSKLLTNLTADADSVKNFISQGMVLAFAGIIQLVGSIILLLSINWQLALVVFISIPVLIVSFGVIFKAIEKYFVKAQEIIDKLNRVINESIVGSSLIRVLNAQGFEYQKFGIANAEAKSIGIKIITGFAALIPIINLVVNAVSLAILGYGGVQVIDGTLSTGDFAAFFSYIFIFIGPIIMLGFLATEIQRAFVTYSRIREVIDADEPERHGTVKKEINGGIKLKEITLDMGNRRILDNINFEVKPGAKVGIIGPTAAGKTQIFYLITGLILPDSGEILIDGTPITEYDADNLYSQVGMVFQDSIIFNATLRENIAFRPNTSDEAVWKAIETAELKDFVDTLPEGLNTMITERGTSLSGGQKQRLTLARALSMNPKVLLLDDFTARVDINTEKRILENLKKNYPNITIVAITQKIESVTDFDQVILVMEGELVASGKHEELLDKSLEYQQIFNSQKRTEE